MAQENPQLTLILEHDPATTTTYRNEDGSAKKKSTRESQHHDKSQRGITPIVNIPKNMRQEVKVVGMNTD